MIPGEKQINKDSFGPVESWRFNPVNGQPLERGIKNFKNLFRKPTLSEWINLIIIIIALVGAYFYYQDTKTCRETLNNLPIICSQYQASEQAIDEMNAEQRKEFGLLNNFTIQNYSITITNESAQEL